jgi:hypothetical protein
MNYRRSNQKSEKGVREKRGKINTGTSGIKERGTGDSG